MAKQGVAIRSTKPGTKKVDIVNTKEYLILWCDESMTMMQLAEHIAQHGSKFTRGDTYGDSG